VCKREYVRPGVYLQGKIWCCGPCILRSEIVQKNKNRYFSSFVNNSMMYNVLERGHIFVSLDNLKQVGKGQAPCKVLFQM
jgi:hypothetical protein